LTIASSPSSSSKNAEEKTSKTKVYYGADNVINIELEFFYNSKNNKIDTCMNYTRPQLAIEIQSIKKAFIDAKSRGVRLRYLTDIRAENISFCKELATIVDELGHLDGIKGSFMVSESEYLAPLILYNTGKIAPQIIYSNIKELVEQQQYMFDTLWRKATSAEMRIKEIEEGVGVHYETKILEKQDEIIEELKYKSKADNELDDWSICSTFDGLAMLMTFDNDDNNNNSGYSNIQKSILNSYQKGKTTRWIGIIDKDNASLVKTSLDLGMKIKHIKSLPPMNFAVSSKEMYATIDEMKGGQIPKNLLITNEPSYVKHFKYAFEELWRKGMDAKDRIADIEKGIKTADVEVIETPKESINRAYDISISAKEELLVAFPTTNSFRRNIRAGVCIQLLKQEYVRENNVKVRILTPVDKQILQYMEDLKGILPQVDVRVIDETIESRITIVLADRKRCLIVETKDDTTDNLFEAAGLSIYSNSKSIVSSYLSIFESLWKQSELYEQLKVHDKMQKEFINVAAHELRTPIQPIIGLAEVLRSNKVQDISHQQELLDAIIRNGIRLKQLTEDMLDVSKIESKLLNLKKEQLNLNDLISNILQDYYKYELEKANRDIKLLLNKPGNHQEAIFVEADRHRLTQVIYNLLGNAVKFTSKKEGVGGEEETILVNIKKEEDDDSKEVIVSIKDRGVGIDPEIMPRLFSKFATKSFEGTGLGLYISKGIIEAHGGKMWAENNSDGKGATFYFSLPLNR
jgi:two-component system, OmpR family, sensor histidine kinase VicK